MGIPERIYKISKAYIGQIRDRLDAGLERLEDQVDDRLSDAERELNASTDPTASPYERYSRDDASPDAMMRRAEERIAAARRDLESRSELRSPASAPGTTGDASAVPAPAVRRDTPAPTTGTAAAAALAPDDPALRNYKLLGVPPGSDLATVQAAYEKLALRCDPRRFDDGSEEQKEAQLILARIHAAYETLRKRLDPTESRFGKLELE